MKEDPDVLVMLYKKRAHEVTRTPLTWTKVTFYSFLVAFSLAIVIGEVWIK